MRIRLRSPQKSRSQREPDELSAALTYPIRRRVILPVLNLLIRMIPTPCVTHTGILFGPVRAVKRRPSKYNGFLRIVMWSGRQCCSGRADHCGIPTRRIKSWNRGSERKLSNAGCTLRLIIKSSRSSKPLSSHSNAHCLSPTRTHASATSTEGT